MVVRSVSGVTEVVPRDWEVLPSTAGAFRDPEWLADRGWLPATVPGTVASSARSWEVAQLPPALSAPDEHDWWYRCRFTAEVPSGALAILRLEGLATIADVWLNGEPVLTSDNMFLAHALDVGERLRRGGVNELVVRFGALGPLLARRRPRPRWRTRLVSQPNLRWYRTTLLGRIPSWSAGQAPVGPWRPVVLAVAMRLAVIRAELAVRLEEGTGVVEVAVEVSPAGGRAVTAARLRLGGRMFPLAVAGALLAGEGRLPDVEPWMPHTHGRPARYAVGLEVDLDDGERVDVDLDRTGFRTVRFTGDQDAFALRVNDVDIFFRGGCWTPLDPLALTSDEQGYRRALEQVRDAGANMVRLCAPFCYETDDFLTTCDELGIAVWQDFMFANMDYPFGDEQFGASVSEEVAQVLNQLAPHPCATVLCGNSEVSQQAAMLGLPADQWSDEWYDRILRDECGRRVPGAAYWPSSPSGGPLPMHPAAGDSHYQGVGAYLRDFSDAETSGVRFASETLSFANVPEPGSLERFAGAADLSVQSPWWKSGVARDPGAGWDFDDIRDEYLGRLFRVDPMRVRYECPERYFALARVTTGEVMTRVFAVWRSGVAPCRGGLVWFWRDLRPGAGWGVVDAYGVPKAAYYYLRRAWLPVTVFLVDRGLNGLHARVVNDRPASADLMLRISVYPCDAVQPFRGEHRLKVPPHGVVGVAVEEVVGGFRDLNHAYRFGPGAYDLIHAELVDPAGDGAAIADDIYFPAGLSQPVRADIGLTVNCRPYRDGWMVSVAATRAAQAVRVDVPGYLPHDNYFHLAPGQTRQVHLRSVDDERPGAGSVSALNSRTTTALVLGGPIAAGP